MFSARGIAQRYRADPTMRGLCQNVVAVAGLIAETGRTLHQSEYTELVELAKLPKTDLESQLRSVDRFLRGPDPAGRRKLLARFGIFGIRLGTSLVRQGATSPAALATELVGRSGLGELQRILQTQFMQRRDLLKARSALLAVDSVLRATGRGEPLLQDIERILAGAHELAELRLLAALRSGLVELPKGAATEAERLLGDSGAAAATRLGLAPETSGDELRREAYAALDRWQRHAMNPMFGRTTADACRVVVRSCEGVLAGLHSQSRHSRGSVPAG
jgi:hypothetical protein